jgi:hypothetical protein
LCAPLLWRGGLSRVVPRTPGRQTMRTALIFSGFGALAIGAVVYFGAFSLPR